jgi:hypothetical protein
VAGFTSNPVDVTIPVKEAAAPERRFTTVALVAAMEPVAIATELLIVSAFKTPTFTVPVVVSELQSIFPIVVSVPGGVKLRTVPFKITEFTTPASIVPVVVSALQSISPIVVNVPGGVKSIDVAFKVLQLIVPGVVIVPGGKRVRLV